MERALRVFGEVRSGEAGTLLLMLLNLFLLLVGYYVIKTVRDTLILVHGGAEVAAYSAAGQALVLVGFIPLYSWFASRVDRARLIFGVILFFVANIEMFFLAARLNVPYLSVLLYIWVGIFNVSMIAQFWSFANDLYPQAAGERLFPVIAIGATLGGPLGGKLAQLLFEGGVNAYLMLQISALILLAHLGVYALILRRESRRRDQVAASQAPLARGDGFALVFASPYVRSIALLLIILNVVNTNGNFILNSTLGRAAAAATAADPSLSSEAFIGSFWGRFYFHQNLLTVLLQALFVSRIVKYLGIRGVLLTLPFVAFGAYGLIGAGAALGVMRWAKIAENATDYSVMNTARAMLWLPTSREQKYKAKQAVDTFFVRAGDVLSGGLVFAATHWLSLGVRSFAFANVGLVLAWLAVASRLLGAHDRLAAAQAPSGAALQE